MDLQLKGHRAVVTGSSAGIGEAMARRLAAEGAAVIVHGRRADAIDAVVKGIRSAGRRGWGQDWPAIEAGVLADILDNPPAALAGRRRWPTWSPSWSARWRATSPAPTCASTAAAPPWCEQPRHDLATEGEQHAVRYTLLGNSGLRVSELALGTMTFGTDWGWGASESESAKQFELFAEAGGTLIDTANKYTDGSAESILGELLATDRDHFVVGTKYSLNVRDGDLNAGGNHRKSLVQALEGSLRRLRTDHVDILRLHAWDYLTPPEEVIRALDDQVRLGKVLYLGVSDTRLGGGADADPGRGARPGPVCRAADRILPRPARG
jgi:Aldo/keto reductase family/short chain dehydrogenase